MLIIFSRIQYFPPRKEIADKSEFAFLNTKILFGLKAARMTKIIEITKWLENYQFQNALSPRLKSKLHWNNKRRLLKSSWNSCKWPNKITKIDFCLAFKFTFEQLGNNNSNELLERFNKQHFENRDHYKAC